MYAASRNINIIEDEEHAVFECPEFDTSRQKYYEIFSLTEINLKYCMNIDSQESTSNFRWDMRNIHINFGSEC